MNYTDTTLAAQLRDSEADDIDLRDYRSPYSRATPHLPTSPVSHETRTVSHRIEHRTRNVRLLLLVNDTVIKSRKWGECCMKHPEINTGTNSPSKSYAAKRCCVDPVSRSAKKGITYGLAEELLKDSFIPVYSCNQMKAEIIHDKD
jgi:hypothetical protein